MADVRARMKHACLRASLMVRVCAMGVMLCAGDVAMAAGSDGMPAPVSPLPLAEAIGQGLNQERVKALNQFLQDQVDQGFPGGQLVVLRAGSVVLNQAFGYKRLWNELDRLPAPEPTGSDVLYDMASNTKIYATVLALMHLVYQGKVEVDAPVSRYIAGFADAPQDAVKGKNTLTLRHLLAHNAGFLADPRYYDPKDPRVGEALYSQERSLTLQKLLKTPLVKPPGTRHVYSDVDFLLLGMVIENVTGQPLDAYVESTFYKPLGLHHVMFNPMAKGMAPDRTAATERLGNTRDGTITFPRVRTHTIQGQVHDEKSFYSMGGVSGHAGLFGPAREVAVLAQLFLGAGRLGERTFFTQKELDLFTTPAPGDASYGLGWRLNLGATPSWFSPRSSPKAYGHTGWTGIVTVIDPAYELAIVLFTNKKHSPVVNPKENSNRFLGDALPLGQYGPLVDAVYAALE